jgi:hypothetical protein
MVGLAIDLFCPSPYAVTLVLYMIPNFIQGLVDGVMGSISVITTSLGK